MNWDDLVRAERPALVARLVRVTGDWDLAEECVQEALLKGWTEWKGTPPQRPGAWLWVVARNRALDQGRRRRVGEAKLRSLAVEQAPDPQPETLDLLFTCCHPALSLEARVALTLRHGTGLSTAEVARAFLTTEDTMTRRLTRARDRIAGARIPWGVPGEPARSERLTGVLGVLYLLFTQGNDAAPGDHRALLAREALQLTRMVVDEWPAEAEARGLLALELLTAARRPARFDQGQVVSLEHQDRSRWDQDLLKEGLEQLTEAWAGNPGPYGLQAAIAGCHARAPSAAETDFAAIAGLYARLDSLAPSPVVRLNRAVAVGLSQGPRAGLALLDELAADPKLARYAYLPASRADLLGRLGRFDEAAVEFRRAAALSTSEPEQRFLLGRADDAERRHRDQTVTFDTSPVPPADP